MLFHKNTISTIYLSQHSEMPSEQFLFFFNSVFSLLSKFDDEIFILKLLHPSLSSGIFLAPPIICCQAKFVRVFLPLERIDFISRSSRLDKNNNNNNNKKQKKKQKQKTKTKKKKSAKVNENKKEQSFHMK